MSFGLAWVIAVFLELAIFSDTITDKIKRDHVTVNQPIFQKIEQYQAGLAAEIEQRRKSLAALESLYREELAKRPSSKRRSPRNSSELEQQIKALDAQESELRVELRQIQEQIKTYAADMNAEQLGQRINAEQQRTCRGRDRATSSPSSRRKSTSSNRPRAKARSRNCARSATT